MKWLEILSDFNLMYWIAGLFALLELFKWLWTFSEWVVSQFGIETKNMREKRIQSDRLTTAENNIQDIKNTSEDNFKLFVEHEKALNDNFLSVQKEMIGEISRLHDKIDEQYKHLEMIDKEGKKRDCTVFRDRLISGLRYFSQNKDEHGVVHISMTDYENLNSLFTEYFTAGGNGVIQHLYETEFQSFKIDNNTIQ